MRSAARNAVQPLDGNDAQSSGAAGGVPQVRGGNGILVRDDDGAILPNRFVGSSLRGNHLFDPDCRNFEIESRNLLAQVKAAGFDAELFDENSREQVLAAMLLHVIETARPVDATINFGCGYWRRGAMRDAFLFVDDIHDRGS